MAHDIFIEYLIIFPTISSGLKLPIKIESTLLQNMILMLLFIQNCKRQEKWDYDPFSLCEPPNFVYFVATDWQQNEYIYRFDLLLNPTLSSIRYKMAKYKYLHNKLHLRRRKFDEMCFLCALW